jgi:NMD protein affecting ribosome stability and mRNA decay
MATYEDWSEPEVARLRCPDCGSTVYTRTRWVYAYLPSVDETRESLEREWYCSNPHCDFYDIDPADLTD